MLGVGLMYKIGIKNMRSLVDIKEVELRPITVLVGKNSSGKSTFLRTFPLLKQTLETKTSVPILWFGDYVDFGDFRESINRNTDEGTIGLTFEFLLSQYNDILFLRSGFRRKAFALSRDNELKVRIDISLNEKYIQRLCIEIGNQNIIFELKDNGAITKLLINSEEMRHRELRWSSGIKCLLPDIHFTNEKEFVYIEENFFEDAFIEALRSKSHTNTRRETIKKAIHNIKIGNISDTYKYIVDSNAPGSLKEKLKSLGECDYEFMKINNLFIASKLKEILYLCNQLINNTAHSVKYMKPVRANADRYYRIQGLSVDQIDASGRNIPMFLHNLSEHERKNFENWSKETFDLIFFTSSKQGHLSMFVKDSTTNESYNLADTGYGYSQILPIIVLLWLSKRERQVTYITNSIRRLINSNIIVIEQPELHLHPAFQAKLIDVFARVANQVNQDYNTDIKIIFETHSETMINRLGYLVAKDVLKKEDINILIFNKNGNQTTTIESISFNENGSLKNWPIGFFAPERF